MTAQQPFESVQTPEALAEFAAHPEVAAARQAAERDALLEALLVAQDAARRAIDAAAGIRDWGVSMLLQFADLARTAEAHLERGDAESVKVILAVIAPRRRRQALPRRVAMSIEPQEFGCVGAPFEVKFADDGAAPGTFEHLLRELGFSRKFSAAVTAGGFKAALGRRDGGDDDALNALAAEIRAGALAIKNMKA